MPKLVIVALELFVPVGGYAKEERKSRRWRTTTRKEELRHNTEDWAIMRTWWTRFSHRLTPRRRWAQQLGDRAWLRLACGFEARTKYNDARRHKRNGWSLNRPRCWRCLISHNYTTIRDIAGHISKDRLNNKYIDLIHVILKNNSEETTFVLQKKELKRRKTKKKYIRPTLFCLLGKVVIKSHRNRMLNLLG